MLAKYSCKQEALSETLLHSLGCEEKVKYSTADLEQQGLNRPAPTYAHMVSISMVQCCKCIFL